MSTKAGTIVFVDHHDNARDDLAWTHVGELGLRRQLIKPFSGDSFDDISGPVSGTIIYGGSQNVTEQDQYPFLKDEIAWIRHCLCQNTPMLGICLGAQLIAHCLGAEVLARQPEECEFGYYPITPTAEGQTWIPDPLYVTQAHFQEFLMPDGATLMATGERFPNQAFRYGNHVIGLQFHPEVTTEIFRRWQNADWAMYGVNGAQTREQQDALITEHSAIQGNWFRQVLASLFLSEKH